MQSHHKFPPLGEPKDLTIVAYGDASHASLPNGASQGGSIVFLMGKDGTCAPISWKSKKLDRVTKSPLASEVSAQADTADSGYLVSSMVKEIFALSSAPNIELRTDSKSLVDHLESTQVIQDARLRVDIARLREMVRLKEIELKWVRGKEQLADCLTKRGASSDLLRENLSTETF